MAQAKESVVTDAELEQAIASKDVRVISTLLALAITKKDLFAIKHLLENGGDLNCPLQDGTNPMLYVIRVNDKKVSDFVEGFCDEKTIEKWDMQLDLLQAMEDQKMAQQSSAEQKPARRLSEGSFVANMNQSAQPPSSQAASNNASVGRQGPPSAQQHAPAPAPAKKSGCTLM